jgi:SAM-dependent methyltransferase
MQRDYEIQYHLIEEDHYWFRGRRHIVNQLLLQTNSDLECRILEIGCSGGPLMRQLSQNGYRHVTGIDISPDAISLCRRRGFHDSHVMDAQDPSFGDSVFDVITASDVLEHLADAPKAVRAWARLLKPGGVLIVFVPAFRFLWTEHDEVNHHFQRYHRRELRHLLASNGLRVERSSYWNFLLFFPVAVIRLIKKILPKRKAAGTGDMFTPPTLINRALTAMLRLENRLLLSGVNYPVGVSVMAVGRKAL